MTRLVSALQLRCMSRLTLHDPRSRCVTLLLNLVQLIQSNGVVGVPTWQVAARVPRRGASSVSMQLPGSILAVVLYWGYHWGGK